MAASARLVSSKPITWPNVSASGEIANLVAARSAASSFEHQQHAFCPLPASRTPTQMDNRPTGQ